MKKSFVMKHEREKRQENSMKTCNFGKHSCSRKEFNYKKNKIEK